MLKSIPAFLFIAICFSLHAFAQDNDSAVIRKIYDDVLQHGQAYRNLEELSLKIGARLSGSQQAAAAVKWAQQKMREAGADTVWLQEVWVPRWVRGEKEKGAIVQNGKKQTVPVCALGMSVATPKDRLSAHD